MKTLNRNFGLIGCLLLAGTFSCKIEDEYSNPRGFENLGRKIYSSKSNTIALLWSESTNEILLFNYNGIVAIDPESEKTRSLPLNASYPTMSAWVVGNTIFHLNSRNELGRVDLTTLHEIGTLVDSVLFDPFSSSFTTTHFAYSKYDEFTYQPSIFLYDLKSHVETYIGTGLPRVFSPDGEQLLISNVGAFYAYNLRTKATTPLNFIEDGGLKLLTWTEDGIISFQPGYEDIIAKNETINQALGNWRTAIGVYPSVVSRSGKHIIIGEAFCGDTRITSGSYCPYRSSMKYSIVDVNTDATESMAQTINGNVAFAFSPDEKTFAFATINNDIYISEPQN